MLFLENIYITMIVWTSVFCWSCFWILVLISRNKMIKAQKMLNSHRTIPENTMMQHGMRQDSNRGIGVTSVQQSHNNAWFNLSD